MRPPYAWTSTIANLSTMLATVAGAAPPAAAGGAPEIRGLWQATAPGRWDQARFSAEGDYVLLQHRADGLRIVVWGRYDATRIAPSRVLIHLKPKDWDPAETCADFADQNSCHKFHFAPGQLEVTLEGPDAILVGSGPDAVEFFRHKDDRTLVPQQT